jgi:hypothetical protein
MEFAKECIQRALHYHPNSSKAQHRMGNFILMDTGNLAEAIHHYCRAIACDTRNFPAKADLMKAYMSSAQENADKILELIDAELENPDYNLNRIVSIYFIKGCFYLLFYDEKHPEHEISAALEWLKACEIASDSLDFKSISFMAKRYKWPKGRLNIKAVSSAIQNLMQSGKVDLSNEHLIRLEKIAQKNKDEAFNHYQQTRGVNNTGRGGYTARGRAPLGLQRRKSESLMVPESGSSASVAPTPAAPGTRRPRRWSNSASADSGGMKVVVIRQPRPPQGPGFALSGRPADLAELGTIN